MIRSMTSAVAVLCGLAVTAQAMAQQTLEQIVEASNPAAVAMHKYFPDDFTAMIAALKVLPHPDAVTVRATALPYVTRVVTSHSSQIDEASGTATLILTMDEMRAVRDKSPAACVDLVDGRATSVDQTLIPAALQTRYALNTAAAFEQIGARPAAPATPMTTAQLGRFAKQGYDQLPVDTQAVVGPVLAGRPPQTYAEVHAMCDLYLAMLDSVLHGPTGSVRGFMAMGTTR
jgi:hypothetical protein